MRAPRLSGKGPAPRWLCQKPPGAVRRDPPAPATLVEKEKNVGISWIQGRNIYVKMYVYIYICVCVYLYLSIYLFILIYIYMYMCVFIYIYNLFIYIFVYLFPYIFLIDIY